MLTTGGKGKTLEAQDPLFRRGGPTLQTSLTSRELPPRAPAFAWRKFLSLCFGRVLLGEVFISGGRRFALKSAASHPIDGWKAFGSRVRFIIRMHPTRQRSATAALCNKFIPPKTTKTSPKSPPLSKSETNFHFVSGGDLGEVLGERGRFGGREPRLSRGGLSPSKVFLPFPAHFTYSNSKS